jgi:hypothetical protein
LWKRYLLLIVAIYHSNNKRDQKKRKRKRKRGTYRISLALYISIELPIHLYDVLLQQDAMGLAHLIGGTIEVEDLHGVLCPPYHVELPIGGLVDQYGRIWG